MRKYLPLLLVLLLFTGCTVFDFVDRAAVKKTIMELDSPMNSEDAALFEALEDYTPNDALARDSSFDITLKFGEWQKQVTAITVNGFDATATVKWTYPINLIHTKDEVTTEIDLSIYGEGTYELTKDTDGTWKITRFPLFVWHSAHGAKVSDIVFRSDKQTLSATIQPTVDVKPAEVAVLGWVHKEILPFFLTQGPDSSTIYSRDVYLPLVSGKPYRGLILVLTSPADSLKYGITIAFFESIAL